MFIGRTLYWLLTGALIGFGVIALAGLAWPLLHQLLVRVHRAGM